MGDLTDHFSRREFACKCGCGLDRIDEGFAANLECSRRATGLPYVIVSGCRCPMYNEDVGGKGRSAHLPKNEKGDIDIRNGKCRAADILAQDTRILYKVVWDMIRRFHRVEIGKKIDSLGRVTYWVHVDMDSNLPQEVLIIEVKEDK